MHEWAHFFDTLADYIGYVWDISYVPLWNMIKTFACGWIASSIMRFTPDPGMEFKAKVSLSATIIFMLCIMELSRVLTGLSVGVSPFISLLLLMIAYRLHVAQGNVANLRAA